MEHELYISILNMILTERWGEGYAYVLSVSTKGVLEIDSNIYVEKTEDFPMKLREHLMEYRSKNDKG